MNPIAPNDPDKESIDRLFPGVMRVGDRYEMDCGPMKGTGRCIRRKLTPRKGVVFTIQYDDGAIREWEWFD